MAITIDVRYNVDTKDLDKANKKLKATKKATKSLAASANGIKLLSQAFLAVAAAAGAVFVATDKALGKLDKIAKSAKNVGLGAEAFQELAHAADLSGVSVDLFQKSMLKLQKASIDAQDGLLTQKRAFDRMGISIKNLQDLSPEELFNRTADGIAAMTDPVLRSSAAMAIFGTRGADMIEFLRQGSSKISDMRAEALKLGIVLSEEFLSAAEQSNDELNTMKEIISKQWLVIWAELAPTVLKVSDAFVKLVKAFTGLSTAATPLRKQLIDIKKELRDIDTELSKTKGFWEQAFNAMGFATKEVTSIRKRQATETKAAIETEIKVSEDLVATKLKDVKATKEKSDAEKQEIEDRKTNWQTKKDLAATAFQFEKDLNTQARELKIAGIEDEKMRSQAFLEFEKEQFIQRLDNEGIFGEARIALIESFDNVQKEKAKATDKVVTENKKTALEKTFDHFTDMQARIDETTASSFNKMGDALTDFVMTGKGSFKDMANAIIADFTRMIIKALIFQAISGVPGLFSAGGVTAGEPAAKGTLTSGTERFANGGSVGRRGEQGQEVIMPLRRDSQGRMGIAGQSGGGSKAVNLTSHVTINNPKGDGGDVANQVTKQVETALRVLIKSEMNDLVRPGNSLNRNIVNVGGI